MSFVENHTAGYKAYLDLLDSFSAKEISEKCGLEWSRIETLARSYGESKPASIFLGYGVNKWTHSPEMIRLIDALGALTGNIGRSGGGVNHGFQTRRHFDMKLLAPEAVAFRRDIPEPMLGQGILEAEDPPIKMIWVNGSNPVVSCPNSGKVIRALKSLDFVVVVDHFMTDTADLAHLFLPTTTFLEEEDVVVSWGHNWIGPVNKAIEPLGECRSDLHIAQAVAGRLGLGEKMAGTTRDWLKRFLQPMERAGLTLERVMESPVRCPVAPMVAFEDRKFMTPSGKFEFVNSFCDERKAERPYHLLTVLAEKWLNSSILEEDHPKMARAIVHPALANVKGLVDGSKLLIRSGVGELVAEVRSSDDVREDTVMLPHGTWIKRGGAANQLTEDLVSTSGDMAAYYSTMVTIEPKAD
jgi:anaerobic selenocysteine-containing dehydrogenase